MTSPLTGLIAAPFTAFHFDGSLNLKTIPSQADLLAHNKVNGAFICGTTGEGSSMTLRERLQVAEAWKRSAPPELKIIVHVGCLNLGDCQELASHAQALGVNAIASIGPSFYKPPGAQELVAWCREVARGAPNLPFYYYHMPAMTAVNIPATDFLSTDCGQIPTLRGIKFTHEDLVDFGQAITFEGSRFDVLFGRDEILLEGLRLGATGAVGSTYNYAAPLFNRLMQAFAAGDLVEAEHAQTQAVQFIDVLQKHGGLAAGKSIMKLIGVDCGPVRLPLRKLDSSDETSLRQDLDAVGFFDYCCQLP
jgi:N-acetylneuraminate lyase